MNMQFFDSTQRLFSSAQTLGSSALSALSAHRIVVCFMLCVCASGCSSWIPWTDPGKLAKQTEKYGPTADQRIRTLHEQAKVAAAADGDKQAAFTADLAKSIVVEHDPRVRCEIISIATNFNTPSALGICEGGLEDPEISVRLSACDSWGERGGEDAVPLLGERFLKDAELDVRLSAIRTLGSLRDKAAIPTLAKALEDPDPAVQYRAVASLKQVSGRDLGDDVNAWREWALDPTSSSAAWSITETFRKIF